MADNGTGPLLRAAEEWRRAGDDAGAAEAYRGVLARDPAQLAALLGLAAVTVRRAGHAEARPFLERAVAAHPAHGGARLLLAESLAALGRAEEAAAAFWLVPGHSAAHAAGALVGLARLARPEDGPAALELFRAALTHSPDSLGIRLEIAQELWRLARADEAEAAYADILARAPGHLGALLTLGRIARQRGDRDLALDRFAAAATAHPAHPGARLELAHELRDAGRPEEAEAAYAAVLEAGGATLAPALLGLGQLARRRGDIPAAEAMFRRAVASGTAAIAARLELAHLLRDTARTAPAEAEYRAVLEASGEAPRQAASALLGLGVLHRLRGERDESLSCFEAARDLVGEVNDGLAAAILLEIAAERRDRGEAEEAARLLDGVLAAEPRNLAALLGRGLLARARGDRPAALAAFLAAAALHPANPQPLAEAALEHRGLGDPEAARAALAAALELDPCHLGARLQQADLLWMAEDMDGALALCRRIAADRPDCIQAPLDAARALGALGRPAEAAAALDEAEARFGAQPAIALRRAELMAQAGEAAEADRVLARAAEATPGHAGLWVRRAQSAIALGRLEEAAAMLADPAACPGQTVQDRAAVALLRGQLADARWQPAAALAHQEDALRLNPLHTGAMVEAARACLLLMDVEGAWRHLETSLALGASGLLLRGLVPRISQNHLGQILDEFRCDPALVAQLATLSALPPEARLGPVLEAVRGAPDSTAAAICLLLALRQAGMFDAAARAGAAEPAIPRRIAQYWDAAEAPEDVLALMATWPAVNAGWEHLRFDDAGARRFLLGRIAAGAMSAAVMQAYLRAPMPAQKADLFRLAWLASEGGFWLDADDRAVAPLAGLHPSGATLVLYQEEYATLGNNMMGAAPGHPVVLRALALASEAVVRGDTDLVWLSTGPGLLSRAFAQVLAEDGLDAGWFTRCAVAERGHLAGHVARHCRVAYKATERHWLRALAGPARR